MWCATCGCGIGLYEGYSKVVQSLIEFHVYFTIRRILCELGVALPDTDAFNPLDNPIDKGKYQALCKEFGLDDPDFRWTRGTNGGLGDVHAYDHVHEHYSNVQTNPWFSKNEKKWPSGGLHFSDESGSSNKVIQSIRNDAHHGKQHEWFALWKGRGITRVGLGRLNRSIEALVYCVLGAQANVRNPIVGSGGGVQEAQQEMLLLFESAVIEESISKSITRYQLAIQNAKVELDFAIAPGTWLLPSELVNNTTSVEDNNEPKKASNGMRFGVNDGLNRKDIVKETIQIGNDLQIVDQTDDADDDNEISKSTTEVDNNGSTVAEKNVSTIHENNLASIAVVVGGAAWWWFR